MGRNPNLVFRSLAVAALGIGLFSHDAMAGAKPQSAAQSYPLITLQTPLARDADTFSDDKALVKSCAAKGQPQSTCICVTHVLKYELTLNEYSAAVRLYDQSADAKTVTAALYKDGLSPSDIATAREVMRDLTTASDFQDRCAEAKAYYRPKSR